MAGLAGVGLGSGDGFFYDEVQICFMIDMMETLLDVLYAR